MISFEFSDVRLSFNEVGPTTGEKSYTPADRETWIQCMLHSSSGTLLQKRKEEWPSIESMVLGYNRVQKIAKLVKFSLGRRTSNM